jgi:circadian clock protein KaiC
VANPAPAVIGRAGFEVVGVQPARMDYPTFAERVSSGVPKLDALLGGGYLRATSVLVSGAPGTIKTSLAASFAAAACGRGEKGLFVSFDESGAQITANVRSIGLDMAPFVSSGLLRFHSLMSAGSSPEEHFARIRDILIDFEPSCLVVDPISSMMKHGYAFAGLICSTLLDFAKSKGITVFCSSLLDHAGGLEEFSASEVSTIADTWIHVSFAAQDGERNRALTIIKSRGTAHSNQVRELVVNASGIDLVDVYIAEGEVLMGSARAQKEAEVERREALRILEAHHRRLTLDREITELTQAVEAATVALKLKKRESEVIQSADEAFFESERAATVQRIWLRRPADGNAA